ncbi:ABC transporter permease [Parvimonas micra]
MLGFLYLFAYAPMLETNDADMKIFSGYENLIPLYGVLNMTVFCVLAAVIYSKIIIEEYSGKRPILLFSYPINRKKIMLSKLCIVFVFTVIAMFISNFLIFIIFGVSEKFLHLVSGDFTYSIMFQAIETTLIMSLSAASIGIIAVGIGFIKKSVPTTIVSAVLIASLMCNIVANTTSSKIAMYIFVAVMILIGIMFSAILMKKVEVMEVE